jgi:beta-ketodecanoyl-[acyl-carrier-protein] synthase
MTEAVIAATGLYTPPYSLSNAELVETFNAYVERFNAANAAAIAAGEVAAAPSSPSSSRRPRASSRASCRQDRPRRPERMRRTSPSARTTSSRCWPRSRSRRPQAHRALGQDGREIDAVICAASNMQRAYPAMAIEVQQALGIGGFAFDIETWPARRRPSGSRPPPTS